MSQIRNERGEKFKTEDERGAHISEFYSNIYKKRLDNIISIEDFLGS
jgi:hypothetical protein